MLNDKNGWENSEKNLVTGIVSEKENPNSKEKR
jgi:hypothetical protein